MDEFYRSPYRSQTVDPDHNHITSGIIHAWLNLELLRAIWDGLDSGGTLFFSMPVGSWERAFWVAKHIDKIKLFTEFGDPVCATCQERFVESYPIGVHETRTLLGRAYGNFRNPYGNFRDPLSKP